MIARLLAAAISSAAVGACTSIGPATVSRDRVDYGAVIGDSWKQQTLLNIVRLHHADFPMFLEVSQVIAGYQLQTTASAGASLQNYVTASSTMPPGIVGSASAGATYIDRPTVIYTPLTGKDFVRKLMSPLPLGAVLSLLQSGYPATTILPIAVDSINGIANASQRPDMARPADPRFDRLAALLLELQRSNDLQIHVERRKDGGESSAITFAQTSGPAAQVRRLLRLSGSAPYPVHDGVGGKSNGISIATRSMLQIMTEIGTFPEAPRSGAGAAGAAPAPLLQIHSGTSVPPHAHVAVQYKGRWFWIADDDVRSKSTLSSVMLLSAVADGGGHPAPSVVTITAN